MKTLKSQTALAEAPEVLIDTSASGRVRPWELYKMANTYIALAYDEVNPKKAERLRGCATWLTYRRGAADGKLKLAHANFCRVRLCPVCQWRRSLKTYGQMKKVLAALDGQYAYVFLTLTMKNCTAAQLQHSITYILEAWRHFIGYKRVEDLMEGYFRALEVTHNLNADTYHPHLHVIIAVQKSYFTSRKYTSQAELTRLWRAALHADYDPVIDVRRVKGSDTRAIAEAAKYSVKASDIICYDDWQLTVDTVRTLDRALDGRRLVAMGGCIREMHRQLMLDDCDEGDLVDIGHAADELTDEQRDEVTYVWHSGYCQYRRQD